MKKFLSMIAIAAIIANFIACSDDDPAPTPNAPEVDAPAVVTGVQVSSSAQIEFDVVIPGGFKSASVSAIGGTAQVTTPLTAGATEGTITVTFTAGGAVGAGSVKLTVVDNLDRDAEATAILNITAGPAITAPQSQVVAISQSTELTFVISATSGYKNSSVVASIGTASIASQPAVGATAGNIVVNYTAPATVTGREGQIATVTLTVTDNGDESSEGEVEVKASKPIVAVQGSVGTGTVNWTKDNIYELDGYVYVNNGVTLNIGPGTILKFAAGQGAASSALIVAKGGKIISSATSTEPIIMTALSDDTDDPTDLNINQRGLWGGLIILGGAPINHSAGITFIEGLTQTDSRNQYGNGTPNDFSTGVNDNSGVYKYISVRHNGTEIATGSEINGVTLGGVGRGTEFHHIEVWGNNDDGFEFFGGTVNTSYLASFYNQDDSYDLDFGWRGQNQFWVAYQEPGFADSDRGAEWDGAHSGNLSATVFTKPIIYNMTLIGAQTAAGGTNAPAFFLTEGMGFEVRNSIVTNFRAGINGQTAGAASNLVRDRANNGDLIFANTIFNAIGTAASLADITAATSDATTRTALDNVIQAVGNANTFANPQLTNIAAGNFNPLPAAAGPAFTGVGTYPGAAVDGFTYTSVNYKGAFGTTNWLLGWTAADEYVIQ